MKPSPKSKPSSNRRRLINSLIFFVIAGGVDYYLLGIAVISWPPAGKLGIVLLAAISAVAVSNFGFFSGKVDNPVIDDALGWLKAEPVSKFFLGGVIAAYIIFIRPAIGSISPYAYLIEWVIVCFAGWRIVASINNSLQTRYSRPYKESPWRKHIQKVDNLVDEEFDKLAILQQDFVEGGPRRNLLNYMKQIMVSNGFEEDEINRSLQPLIEHSEGKIPWYAIWFWRRHFLELNQNRRRQALDYTVNNLEMLSHPAQRKI
jgi:hypothetical protein